MTPLADLGTRTAPHGDALAPARALDGIDSDDMVVHVRVPGRSITFCSLPFDGDWGYVPTVEVTDAAWCPTCIDVQDGIA